MAIPALSSVYGVSQDGLVQAWEAELDNWVWSQPRGDANGSMRPSGSGLAGSAPAPALREYPAYVWPNPAQDMAHFHFWLDGPASVELRVYDVAGDLRRTQTGDFDRKGEHELAWNTLDQAPGPYFCLLRATPRDGSSEAWTAKIKCAVIR